MLPADAFRSACEFGQYCISAFTVNSTCTCTAWPRAYIHSQVSRSGTSSLNTHLIKDTDYELTTCVCYIHVHTYMYMYLNTLRCWMNSPNSSGFAVSFNEGVLCVELYT